MRKVFCCLLAFASMGLVAVSSATAAPIFFDDFEADDAADPALMANWTHNGNGAAPNASRLFDTGNYGGTRLWIASAANASAGTGIDSTATISLLPNTSYEFSAALVAETSDPNRTATGTFDLLIGTSSLIGGPTSFSARGDDAVGGEDSYDDQMTTLLFDSGVGGNLTISIAYDGTDASNPFVGIDNVSINQIPEPTAVALSGLVCTAAASLRRRRSTRVSAFI